MEFDNQSTRQTNTNSADIGREGRDASRSGNFYRQANDEAGGFDLDDETLVSIEAAASTLIYQDVAIRGPEWLRAAAEAKAAMAQRLPGTSEWNIGNGPGSLKNRTYAEREEDENEATAAYLEIMSDAIEAEHSLERERERQEWSRATHSYAGIEMTGAEWGEFADALKGDTALRRWLIDEMMKKGKSQVEAAKQADQVALLARMQSLPENQWTPEMKALDRELDQNPERRAELDDYMNRAQGRKVEIGSEINSTVRQSTQNVSVGVGADLLVSVRVPNSDFPTAPNLTEAHGRALAATEPLDAPKIIQTASISAGPSPAVSPGGGFDV